MTGSGNGILLDFTGLDVNAAEIVEFPVVVPRIPAVGIELHIVGRGAAARQLVLGDDCTGGRAGGARLKLDIQFRAVGTTNLRQVRSNGFIAIWRTLVIACEIL